MLLGYTPQILHCTEGHPTDNIGDTLQNIIGHADILGDTWGNPADFSPGIGGHVPLRQAVHGCGGHPADIFRYVIFGDTPQMLKPAGPLWGDLECIWGHPDIT